MRRVKYLLRWLWTFCPWTVQRKDPGMVAALRRAWWRGLRTGCPFILFIPVSGRKDSER